MDFNYTQPLLPDKPLTQPPVNNYNIATLIILLVIALVVLICILVCLVDKRKMVIRNRRHNIP